MNKAFAALLVLPLCACMILPQKSAKTTLASSDSWCPDDFEVGPGDTCFAIPEKHDKDTPVLVYLHGAYAGHGSAEEWTLLHGATDKGFAVVIPRGRRGLCSWTAEEKDQFCWPQEVDDPQSFKTVVKEWERVLWQVDTILEGGTHKRYVIGLAKGGGFASYVATHGIFPAQAVAIVNGGPLERLPKASGDATPLLLVSARDDVEHRDQAGMMRQLHEELTKSGWAHVYCGRPGSHALSAEDLDASLRFFKRDAEGALKPDLAKGAYTCDGGTVSLADKPEKGAKPDKGEKAVKAEKASK